MPCASGARDGSGVCASFSRSARTTSWAILSNSLRNSMWPGCPSRGAGANIKDVTAQPLNFFVCIIPILARHRTKLAWISSQQEAFVGQRGEKDTERRRHHGHFIHQHIRPHSLVNGARRHVGHLPLATGYAGLRATIDTSHDFSCIQPIGITHPGPRAVDNEQGAVMAALRGCSLGYSLTLAYSVPKSGESCNQERCGIGRRRFAQGERFGLVGCRTLAPGGHGKRRARGNSGGGAGREVVPPLTPLLDNWRPIC